MEGPALAFKVLLILAVVMAIYRRFERVHVPFRDFEAFIRTRPVLVAIRSRDARPIAERLRAELGERAFAGTGKRPWAFYALSLDLEVSDARILIRPRSCELLRVEGEDPTQLVAAVRDAVATADAEVWFHSDIWVDLDEATSAPRGWSLGVSALTPCEEVPAWASAELASAHATDFANCAPVIE